MSSAICFNFDQSKILSSGNGLIKYIKRNDACAFIRSVSSKHPQERSLSFSPRFSSVWFSQSEVVLLLNDSNYRTNLENKTENVLQNDWCIRILACTLLLVSHPFDLSPSRVVVRYSHHTPLQWAEQNRTPVVNNNRCAHADDNLNKIVQYYDKK